MGGQVSSGIWLLRFYVRIGDTGRMKPRHRMPRWLLAGLFLLSGLYFMENPAIRFGAPAPGAPLTGMEHFANLLLAATVATLAFVAVRMFTGAVEKTNRR